MGNTYTRQSSFTDGDVITADLFNNEYDQLLAALQQAQDTPTMALLQKVDLLLNY